MRKLNVRCNPEHALDSTGEGACAVPFEDMDGRVYVGASVDFERSKKEKRVVFSFDRALAVTVPCSAYYMRKLRDEELLPADHETEDFLFPDRAKARAAALRAIESGVAAAAAEAASATLATVEATEAESVEAAPPQAEPEFTATIDIVAK